MLSLYKFKHVKRFRIKCRSIANKTPAKLGNNSVKRLTRIWWKVRTPWRGRCGDGGRRRSPPGPPGPPPMKRRSPSRSRTPRSLLSRICRNKNEKKSVKLGKNNSSCHEQLVHLPTEDREKLAKKSQGWLGKKVARVKNGLKQVKNRAQKG